MVILFVIIYSIIVITSLGIILYFSFTFKRDRKKYSEIIKEYEYLQSQNDALKQYLLMKHGTRIIFKKIEEEENIVKPSEEFWQK